jgi:RNA polymerase primary sigma factor
VDLTTVVRPLTQLCLSDEEFECTACDAFSTQDCWIAEKRIWRDGSEPANVPFDSDRPPAIRRWIPPTQDTSDHLVSALRILHDLGIPTHVDNLRRQERAGARKANISNRRLANLLSGVPWAENSDSDPFIFTPVGNLPSIEVLKNVGSPDEDPGSGSNGRYLPPSLLSTLPTASLTRADEADLGKRIETGLWVKKLGDIHPDTDVHTLLVDAITPLKQTSDAIAHAIGLPTDQPLRARYRSPRFRSNIDGVLDTNTINDISVHLNTSSDEIYANLSTLSIVTSLLVEVEDIVQPRERTAYLHGVVLDSENSKQILFDQNMRLIMSIVRKSYKGNLETEDVFQEGVFGLIRAIDGFNHRKGFKFSTYATWWIRQRIHRAVADTSRPIRLPVHMSDTVWQATRFRQNQEKLGEYDLPVRDVAEAIDVNTTSLEHAEWVSIPPLSLDSGVVNGYHSRLHRYLLDSAPLEDNPMDQAVIADVQERVDNAMSRLPAREQTIIKARFGMVDGVEMTLAEVGEMFGITRERVRQLQKRSMDVLLKDVSLRRLANDLLL